MEIVKVDSSVVLKIGYDGNALLVQYVGGDWYKYSHVPEKLFEQLCNATSVGHFLNTEIKPKYKEFERLSVSPKD